MVAATCFAPTAQSRPTIVAPNAATECAIERKKIESALNQERQEYKVTKMFEIEGIKFYNSVGKIDNYEGHRDVLYFTISTNPTRIINFSAVKR